MKVPKVHLEEDVLLQTATGFKLAANDTNVSPVATINDIPVQEFLQTQALVAFSNDPDTMYNELFSSVSRTLHPLRPVLSYFETPCFYPGPETIVKREDGTVLSHPVLSDVPCNLGRITSGDDFWRKCVFEPEEAAAGTWVSASATERIATSDDTAAGNEYTGGELTAGKGVIRQLRGHPEPEVLGVENNLSGYFLERYEDIAALIIRSFPGLLESFLEHARDHNKTKLIINFQSNPGGHLDASTELMAQLFPNVPPTQKNSMRASLGMQLTLEKKGRCHNHTLAGADIEQVLRKENGRFFDVWQALMKPDATEFASFEDFYGPNDPRWDRNYTQFFQSNYTNTGPSELGHEGIQITGYGNRRRAPDAPPPFNASNIVILTDGACGSACAVAIEILVNAHSGPSIVVGGRPLTGPIQTIGSTKGSMVWESAALSSHFLTYWLKQDFEPIDLTQVASTPFQHLEAFGLARGIKGLNGRNNYGIGDDTETPLQMVYSAADCRIWPTLDMLTDQSRV